MKFFFLNKILSSTFSLWKKLLILLSIAGGILIIIGSDLIAFAYIPTKLLAILANSLGTFIGTFILSLTFFYLKHQIQQEEFTKGVEKEIEARSKDKLLQERTKEIDNLRKTLSNKNGMGSFAKYIPELTLTFLSSKYNITKYYTKKIDEVSGEEGAISIFNTDPELKTYLAVYNREGQVNYKVDLRKLNTIIENGKLIICGKIPIEADVLEATEKKFLLSIIHHQKWNFDKTAPNFRGEPIISEFLPVEEKNLSSEKENVFKGEIEADFSKMLKNVDDERGKQFEALSKKYLEVIAKAWNLSLDFAPDRTSHKTLENIFYEESQKNNILPITDY